MTDTYVSKHPLRGMEGPVMNVAHMADLVCGHVESMFIDGVCSNEPGEPAWHRITDDEVELLTFAVIHLAKMAKDAQKTFDALFKEDVVEQERAASGAALVEMDVSTAALN